MFLRTDVWIAAPSPVDAVSSPQRGGAPHPLCSRIVQSNAARWNVWNAAPFPGGEGASHTVCRRTPRRRTCGMLRHPQGVVDERFAVGAVGEGLSGGGDAALGSRQCGGAVMRLLAVLQPLRVVSLLVGSRWRCVTWRLAAVCPQQWGSLRRRVHSESGAACQIPALIEI